MFKITGIVIIALLFSQTVRQLNAGYSAYVGLAASLVLLFIGLSEIDPVLRYFSELGEFTGRPEYTAALAKALGISLISESAADMCTDLGEYGLGEKVRFAGKCEIMLLALPLMKEIVSVLGTRLK